MGSVRGSYPVDATGADAAFRMVDIFRIAARGTQLPERKMCWAGEDPAITTFYLIPYLFSA